MEIAAKLQIDIIPYINDIVSLDIGLPYKVMSTKCSGMAINYAMKSLSEHDRYGKLCDWNSVCFLDTKSKRENYRTRVYRIFCMYNNFLGDYSRNGGYYARHFNTAISNEHNKIPGKIELQYKRLMIIKQQKVQKDLLINEFGVDCDCQNIIKQYLHYMI